MKELYEKAKRFFARRQYAYRATFKGPLAEEVLQDLAKFCRANRTTFHEDARLHAVAEGRREVWLRIQNHLQLTEAELWELLSGEPDVS